MAEVDPLDPALPSDGVGQAIQAVADDAVDPLGAGGRQDLRKLVRDGSHQPSPVRARAVRRLYRPSAAGFREVALVQAGGHAGLRRADIAGVEASGTEHQRGSGQNTGRWCVFR